MKRKFIFFYLILLCFSFACSDVFVPDISDKTVTLTSPVNGLVTDARTQKFFWEPIEDVESYNIRIVSPSFDSTVTVVLDSTIKGNQLILSLQAGTYEWNVIGLNEAYSTKCCETFRLKINNDTASNLTNQLVKLKTPADQFYTNAPLLTFSWNALSGAEKYRIQVGNANFTNILVDKELSATEYNAGLDFDGLYYWRVRGINETTLTFSAWQQRSFTLDRTVPAAPLLKFPDSGDSIIISAQSPDLRWSSASDMLNDTVFIYNNIQKEVLLLKFTSSNQSMDLDGSVIGGTNTWEDYFWEIQTIDKAGNRSNKSALQRFWAK